MPPVGMTNNGQLIHPIPTHTQKAAKHLQKDEQMGVGYLHHESGVQDFDLAGLWCGVCVLVVSWVLLRVAVLHCGTVGMLWYVADHCWCRACWCGVLL